MRNPTYVQYNKKTMRISELMKIADAPYSTVFIRWNSLGCGKEFDSWVDNYILRKASKCPSCGRKTIAAGLCSKCSKERYTPRITKPKTAAKVYDLRNCNAHKCCKYMKDSCPGIDLLARKPVFRPVDGCFMPVMEESMEQIRGRALRNI